MCNIAKVQCKFSKCRVDEVNMCGAYLYFDNNEETWIHSGQTTVNQFSVHS